MNPWALVAAVALLLANGFFVWAEFAIVAARPTRLERLADEGHRLARLALGATRDLNFVLAGAQLGITMASLGLGFVAEPAVADALEGPLHDLPEGLARGIEVTVALGIVVAAHMVIGEMVPKNLAIAQPERSALLVAAPYRVYATLFRPIIWFLNVVSNTIVKLLGVTPRDTLSTVHSAEEIAAMLAASRRQGILESFQHGLLSRTLGFTRLDARAVMVPRTEVVGVAASSSVAEVERLMVETGHSRVPVYRETIDDVVGFVHAKELLTLPEAEAQGPVPAEVIRPMLVVPESRALPDLLADMRLARRHFAVVVDEHGGVEGVVTLEDVLEELVGDIRDEFDPSEGSLWRLGPRRVLADARLRPDELERSLGLPVPEGEYDTLAGFVMSELGRMPEVGDEIAVGEWVLRVRRMDGHRIDQVEIVEPLPRDAGGADVPGGGEAAGGSQRADSSEPDDHS